MRHHSTIPIFTKKTIRVAIFTEIKVVMSLNTKEKKKQCKMGTAVILNANELMSVFSMRNRQSLNEE